MTNEAVFLQKSGGMGLTAIQWHVTPVTADACDGRRM